MGKKKSSSKPSVPNDAVEEIRQAIHEAIRPLRNEEILEVLEAIGSDIECMEMAAKEEMESQQ